jgi:ATP-dependent Clp protease ATP-binding subunit ClpC
MHERLTDRARKAMQLANQEAHRFNHEYIGTEHILLGLVKEGSGAAANVLKNLDVDLRKIRLEVEKIVQAGPDMIPFPKLPITPRAKKVIELATEEAHRLNHERVGTEHLLLGVLREQEGVAAQVLMNLGLKLQDVRDEVLTLLGSGSGPRAPFDLRPAAGFFQPTAASLRSRVRELEGEVKRLTAELALARLPEGVRAQVVAMDQEIERLTQEKETAVAEQQFDRAAHLRDRCDRLRKQREALLAVPPATEVPLPVIVDDEQPKPSDGPNRTQV